MLIIFILLDILMYVTGTLYGPRLLISHAGRKMTIKCFYATTSVNRHERKFWCKEVPHKSCQTIISTNGFTHQDYKERVSMFDSPQKGILQVTMTQLEKTDSNNYRCGIGKINGGLYAKVNLTVLDGLTMPKSPEIVWGKVSGSVEIQCPSETPKLEMRNKLCKMIHSSCFPIPDKSKSRITMTTGNNSGTFNVIINKLERKDSGIYICGTGTLDKKANARVIQLQVVEESIFFNILRDAQTTCGSQTVTTSSYWHAMSTNEVYKERSSNSEQNLLAVMIPVPVILLFIGVIVILILVKIRQRKAASSTILPKSREGELPHTSQRRLEEHLKNDRDSADESVKNSGEAEAPVASVYCLISQVPNPEDSSENN